MKTVIIVQARMTSTRLPGKVLKPVLGKPLLSYQIERLRNVKLADELVIATTTNETDQPLIDLCTSLNVPYFRGSEDDVLARYYGAAMAYRADTVVRLTSDCPVIDPGVVDKIINYYNVHLPLYNYVSNTLKRSFPRGMDTEVFSVNVLKEIFFEATAPADREHVTPFIYKNPGRYKLANVLCEYDESRHRWTVDTMEDYELIKRIIEALYPQNPNYILDDILKLFEKNPDWFLINSLVEQKHIL
ncbi:cytidylyltransferase domain-containing protein [Pelotomaculum propionicicum]|uniref:cytidylyltransferase domain-containing protein n=1 Tax=Pelotomaculum propionicicum TaxID=258475 RepID=UPI003B761992